MHSATLFLLLVLTLVFLGWMFPAWLPEGGLAAIPYYTETATEIYKLQDEFLVGFYDPFLKQPHMWLLEYIWTFTGGYALASLFLIVINKGRSGGWNLWFLCVTTPILIVWFFGGMWLSVACISISQASLDPFSHSIGSWLISLTTGVLALFLTLALVLTFWVGIPIYVLVVLLLLPGALYALCHGAILLPLVLWQYLHYLFVPHPAEQIYKAGMARGVALPELAQEVGRAMYMHDLKLYNHLPPAWKARNQERRIEGVTKLIKAGRAFQEEFEKYVLQKSRLDD